MAIKKVYIGEKPSDIQFNVTAKVGTTLVKPVDADRGKPMKLSGDSTYVFTADGDPIEAILVAIENYTADGVVVGTVRTGGYKEAIVTDAVWAVGDYVVADAQAADGTANDSDGYHRPKVQVKADVSADYFRWRIVSVVSGTGAGAIVTIERV